MRTVSLSGREWLDEDLRGESGSMSGQKNIFDVVRHVQVDMGAEATKSVHAAQHAHGSLNHKKVLVFFVCAIILLELLANIRM